MRVLYWTPEFYPSIGGIEELSRRLVPALQQRGHEFLIVAAQGQERLPDVSEFHGAPVHRFDFRRALGRRDAAAVQRCRRQIAEIKQRFAPDLVHLHFGDPYGYFHLSTADGHPAPSVVTLHSTVEYRVGPDTLLGRLVEHAAWVVGVSAAALRCVEPAYPLLGRKSSVVYNGLEMPALSPAPLNFDAPKLLCLGRVVREKGFDIAVASLPRIRAAAPASRLLVAGDGDARRDLEQQARALSVGDAVDFLGWVDPDDVAALINRVTAVLVPSRCSDSAPLVAVQAAQLARPLVAARVGGVPESVLHDHTGLLVDKESPEQLADAVIRLLTDRETAARYGAAARARAQDVFSLDRCVDAYDALYRRVAARGVDAPPAQATR